MDGAIENMDTNESFNEEKDNSCKAKTHQSRIDTDNGSDKHGKMGKPEVPRDSSYQASKSKIDKECQIHDLSLDSDDGLTIEDLESLAQHITEVLEKIKRARDRKQRSQKPRQSTSAEPTKKYFLPDFGDRKMTLDDAKIILKINGFTVQEFGRGKSRYLRATLPILRECDAAIVPKKLDVGEEESKKEKEEKAIPKKKIKIPRWLVTVIQKRVFSNFKKWFDGMLNSLIIDEFEGMVLFDADDDDDDDDDKPTGMDVPKGTPPQDQAGETRNEGESKDG